MRRLSFVYCIVILSISFMVTNLTTVTAEAWSNFKVYNFDSGKPVKVDISPAEKASKPWKLYALLPHMKDGYWVSVNYGLVEEAKRLGVKLTILQAGGYSEMAKQVNQYDDCLSTNPDAILIAPIAESGLAAKIEKTAKTGLVQIGFVNPIKTAPVTSKIFVDYATKGRQTGEYLAKLFVERKGKVVAFPGPQGSGWAEAYLNGFHEALEGSTVDILADKFGPAGVAESLILVEDSLQAYPQMNAIWGGAPAAEAAIGAVEEAGKEKDMVIISSYENQTMVDFLKEDKITAFATEFPVMQGRIAVSMAVKALEKKKIPAYMEIIPQMATMDNIEDIDLTTVLAPPGYRPVFSVD
ncbi:TMAO reductase system periplasmic protein TorT [Desulfosarcina ovata]|uniref:TMAO reductase system periplasmic protein TorT n=2 Tax=Desulfosarcina ovata TaxID=83564 RepID=A0A5K8A434_9BACT|nr:TMAO reductase system periplasmic protein TorT [Desulfosarcina ovata]BBO79902.1 TMAO reductase system periplasmic protein TorT [Desulfosarcina ovata subsp. sediminis]BBO87207.1 TMAO reductase system periplasmic protein TorT [Desulfosarcina ovata subsp. ovata]